MSSIFGWEFEEIWPKDKNIRKLTEYERELLQKCIAIEKPQLNKIDINEFMEKSSNFPIKFATDTCRVKSQPQDRHAIIQQQIASAYPVIHERVLGLYLAYLEHKCQYGNDRELEIYRNMTVVDFVQRLLTKRCVTFYSELNRFLLLTGEIGGGGYLNIGTDSEKAPLLLKNVLSCDEVKLSAFLSISSHTEFLNDGNRNNCGIIEEDKSKIERNGVVISLIGARLSPPDLMEFQDIVITKKQNTRANGYGVRENNGDIVDTCAKSYRRVWREFYQEDDFLYEQAAIDKTRFWQSHSKMEIFDNVMMKKRYAISFDTLLLESEARAVAARKQAFIHVVGIGLGSWRAEPQQEKIFLETFTQRVKQLLPRLQHIAVIHFSWFDLSEWGELKDGGIFKSSTHPNGGIRTFLSKRNPAEKLKSPDHDGMLLIVSYAWNSNAFPGNDFWVGVLNSTNDPSTACSTLITELHNPYINTEMVNGNNLHIATVEHGIIHIANYVNKFLYK